MPPPASTELVVDRGEFELSGWMAGTGGAAPPILCLHETATSSGVWRPLADKLAPERRILAYDRRGWGRSGAPDDYRRTTVEEQAADAEAVVDALGSGPVALCGAGLGAVMALELAVHRARVVRSVVLIEPPLLALVPEATAAIAADVEAIRRAVSAAAARVEESAAPREAAAAGAAAALELYRAGGLEALGAGAERIPPELGTASHANPFSLFAEIAATSGWSLPLAELPNLAIPTAVVVGASTPPFVRRAAEELGVRLPAAELRRLPARGLVQLDSSAELASIVRELG